MNLYSTLSHTHTFTYTYIKAQEQYEKREPNSHQQKNENKITKQRCNDRRIKNTHSKHSTLAYIVVKWATAMRCDDDLQTAYTHLYIYLCIVHLYTCSTLYTFFFFIVDSYTRALFLSLSHTHALRRVVANTWMIYFCYIQHSAFRIFYYC